MQQPWEPAWFCIWRNMHIAMFVAFVWAVVCLLFDALNTNKGLRAGVAEEGNWLITTISGTKRPHLWQLLSIDGGLRALILAIGFLPGPAAYPLTFVAIAIGALIVAGFKNIQGGRQWRWMFSHAGQKIPVQNSAWNQFWGFWG